MRVRYWVILLCCLSTLSCGENLADNHQNNTENDVVIDDNIVNAYFSGNGIQWGGYDMVETWTGNATLSESDWDKLFTRIRFMRPPLVRIMVAPGWNYIVDGQYAPEKSNPVLCKMLDFCQQEDIRVIFGEWGHEGGTSINQEWLQNAVNFLDWLINTKGFTCIHYYNMVNEPNGDWSSIKGNYPLWLSLMQQFHAKLVQKGLDSKVVLIGPDVAVWNIGLVSWVDNTVSDLNGKVTAYDIHTYPTETEVRDGSYRLMTEKYRKAVPAGKEMLMGELGFKYKAASELGQQNLQRIASDKYASDDCNMFVYDAFYAIDIADALIQNMIAGYGGNVLWNLDDAMYSVGGYTSTKLKRWGFWNILGAEKFENAADEDIRPWFYTASLLCRYFPRGAKIHSVTLPDKYGLRAVAGEYNGGYTIAIVNSHRVSYTINLKMENGKALDNMKVYKYLSGEGSEFSAKTDEDGFALPNMVEEKVDFTNGKSVSVSVPAQSFYLMTNVE